MKKGVEMSFVREGSVGGWRRYFSDKSKEDVLKQYFGDFPGRLGYR